MKHQIAAALLSVVSITASAQSSGLPPSQPPAGSPEKFMKPSRVSEASKASSDSARLVRKASTKAERKAGRQVTRDARVGPKPLN